MGMVIDMEIDFSPYFKGTNFGHTDYDSIVLEGLMKITCGYANGHTLNQILLRLGYIMPSRSGKNLTTTLLGERVLYSLYENLKKSTI